VHQDRVHVDVLDRIGGSVVVMVVVGWWLLGEVVREVVLVVVVSSGSGSGVGGEEMSERERDDDGGAGVIADVRRVRAHGNVEAAHHAVHVLHLLCCHRPDPTRVQFDRK
jgi:hypothetical protein